MGAISFSPRNLGQVADDSAWNLTSSVSYVPGTSVKSPTRIVITIYLQRQPEQTQDLILIPILALYAFLGTSILLSRENDIGNRLFVYLSIFLFVYVFLSTIRSLSITPFVLGFSMAERFGLALVPCTVILAIASILAWRPRLRRHRMIIDLAGVLLALLSVGSVVQFALPQYVPTAQGYRLGSVVYSLFSLGTFGWLVIFALSSGTILSIGYLVISKVWSIRE